MSWKLRTCCLYTRESVICYSVTYRPVSLLSVLSKILEGMMYNHLISFMDNSQVVLHWRMENMYLVFFAGFQSHLIQLITKETWIQYIPRNMHTVFALLCFVVVIHWLIFPYPPGLLHWHCGNLTIAPVPAKQPWWIWTNTSCEFIMNDCITTTKQSTTKPCAYFLGYTVLWYSCCLSGLV